MQKVYHLLRLIRLHNCLIASLAVWMGGYLSGAEVGHTLIYYASLAAALVCGAGNSLNDYLDISIDRINHPGRPLPREDLKPYFAILAAIIFSITAILLAGCVNWKVLAMVIAATVLLVVYNFKLKKMPFWGNMTISALSGATFLTGGLAVGIQQILSIPGPVVIAVFATLFHLGREFIKDLADWEGDRTAGFKTLPIILSPGIVMVLTSLLYLTLIAITFIPIYYKWYGPAYLYLTMIAVNIPLLLTLLYLWVSKKKNRFNVSGRILKLLMVLGLLAFFLGKK